MRFLRFCTDKHPSGTYGIVSDDRKIEVIAGGLFDPVTRTGESVDEREIVRYLPPVTPPTMFCFGVNYQDHAAETKSELPKVPLTFIKASNALSAHEENIVLPSVAPSCVDFEAELAVIIGKCAKNVPVETALEFVFGYTCANDVSARDCQQNDGQWARGKSFDTFAPIGPYVVTGMDASDVHVRMRLNGTIMQDQSTADLMFKVPQLISFLSHGLTLEPGTVLLTGTPGGVGVSRTPPVFLKPGDVCEVDIDGIGVLRNAVVAE